MFILKPVLTDADYKSIGILLQMSTGKYLHRKRIYVLIESPTRTNQLVQLQHIIVKNPGSKTQMSNSFDLLQGSITNVQKQYEALSDTVIDTGGKVHNSQRDRDTRTGFT